MTGQATIDGADLYTTYGVTITENGYNALVAFAPMKRPELNDWQEENGIELDLSAPKLDTRELNMSFVGSNKAGIDSFITALITGAYHTFVFSEIGQTCSLRLITQSNRQVTGTMETFNLTFADDYPLSGYTYVAPASTGVAIAQTGYTLDGKSLADYGCYVMEGSEAEIRKSPTVKKNLTTNLLSQSGATYDPTTVKFSAKDTTINLTLLATSLAAFWKNYKALLYDLSKAGLRTFASATGGSHSCYYSGASVSKFSPNTARIYCDFSITLVFTT